MPRGFPACVGEAANHGVAILLDRNARCGDNDNRIPRVDIYANYNVAIGARTPAKLARIQCRYLSPRQVQWLNGWSLGGRQAAGCRQDFDEGRISVMIVTLRQTERCVERWIEVSASLDTTVTHYESDMRKFRDILQNVRIHSDRPLE